MPRPALAVVLALLTAASVVVGVAPPASATGSRAATVRVTGAVADPAVYTADDLASLPQVTLPDQRRRSPAEVTGVLLEPLITAAQPQLPEAKNALLRVTLTVGGHHTAVALTLGEITPRFGTIPPCSSPTPTDGTAAST